MNADRCDREGHHLHFKWDSDVEGQAPYCNTCGWTPIMGEDTVYTEAQVAKREAEHNRLLFEYDRLETGNELLAKYRDRLQAREATLEAALREAREWIEREAFDVRYEALSAALSKIDAALGETE